jgi:hypothetical protein
MCLAGSTVPLLAQMKWWIVALLALERSGPEQRREEESLAGLPNLLRGQPRLPAVAAVASFRVSRSRCLMAGGKCYRAARSPLVVRLISRPPREPLALTRPWFRSVPMAHQAWQRPDETRRRQCRRLTLSQMRWRERAALAPSASRRPECGATAFGPLVRAERDSRLTVARPFHVAFQFRRAGRAPYFRRAARTPHHRCATCPRRHRRRSDSASPPSLCWRLRMSASAACAAHASEAWSSVTAAIS